MAQKPGNLDDDDDGEFEKIESESEKALKEEAAELENNAGGEGGADPVETDDVEIVMQTADDNADEAAGDGETDAEGEADPDAEVEQEADDEGLDAEDLTYSKKVQKRIKREQGVTRAAREEAAAARTEFLNERKARLAAELKSVETVKHSCDVMLDSTELSITAKTNALIKAKEDGDTKAEVEIGRELSALERKKDELATAKRNLDGEEARVKAEAAVVPAAAKTVSPAAQQWMGRNKWFRNKAFVAETTLVEKIDRDLAARGLDPSTPGYFRELDAQVKAQMPDLSSKVTRVFKPAPVARGNARSSVAPVSRAGATGTRSGVTNGKRRVTLTLADQETMREFKMDPKNPEHAKQFALSKMGRA